MPDPSFPPDHRNAPLDLWRRMREFLCECFGLFGEPQELADRHTLTFKDYKLTLTWLRAGEALLRRFLLLEAALLEPNSSPVRGGSGSRQGRETKGEVEAARAADLDPTDPESWRVSFRTTVPDRRLPGGTARSHARRRVQIEPPHAGWKPAVRCSGASKTPAPLDRASSDAQSADLKARGAESFAAKIAALSPRFRSAIPLARRFEAMLRVYNNPLPFARRLAARIRRSSALIKRMLNDAWRQSRGIIEQTLHDDLGPRVEASTRQLSPDSS